MSRLDNTSKHLTWTPGHGFEQDVPLKLRQATSTYIHFRFLLKNNFINIWNCKVSFRSLIRYIDITSISLQSR